FTKYPKYIYFGINPNSYNLKTQSLKEIIQICVSRDQFPVLLDRPCCLRRQSYVCGCEVNKGKWRGGLSTNTGGGKED
ncbi:LOW QUALITY PROTEIN: hypothetical protein TorRG33x02_314410, partial [Trema orientale]